MTVSWKELLKMFYILHLYLLLKRPKNVNVNDIFSAKNILSPNQL